MPSFSLIQNITLRELLQASASFNSLSEEKQQKHIVKISKLSPEKQQEVLEFLKIQFPPTQEKLTILTRLYNELLKLEQKFTKLLKKDPELKDREKDEDKLAELLKQLEKS